MGGRTYSSPGLLHAKKPGLIGLSGKLKPLLKSEWLGTHKTDYNSKFKLMQLLLPVFCRGGGTH